MGRGIGIGLGLHRGGKVGAAVPTILLSNLSIAENAANGTTIGTLSVINGSGTYTFTETADPDTKFGVTGTNLNKTAALDYETATSHSVTIHADNGAGSTADRTFTITVTDVDDTAPTITSSNTVSVAENSTLSHALTANETVTWSIVGGADQAKFELSGSTLRWASNGTKNFELPDDADTNNAYVVTVRATDTASNTTDQTITATVTDVTESAVAPILTWDGDTADATPDFNIDFDETAIAVGTVITLRRADDSGFTTNVVDVTDTLDSTEIAAGSINLATGSLANGTYYFKAKDSVNNLYSNVVTVTISATAWTTIADFQTATYTGVTPVCSRTGTAYATDNSGAYSSFGSNTLRRTNKGLLVEPAATNLLTFGVDPSDVNWGSWQVTSVTGGQSDPIGGTTAAEIVPFAGGSGRFGPPSAITYPAGTYIISGHFKRTSGSNDFKIEVNSAHFSSGGHRSAEFNLVTPGTVLNGTGVSNAQIETLSGGWYRCSARFVTDVSNDAPVTTFYTASAAGTFVGWGAQVEAGTKQTSPILTPGGTQVTRPADVVTLTVPSGKTQFRHTLSDGSITTAESVTAGATYTYPTAHAPLYIRKTEAQ